MNAHRPPQTPMAYVDVETGGLRYGDRPWEVAVLSVDPDGTEKQTVIHLSDFRPGDADPKALELGGFYDRHPYHVTPADAGAAAVAVSGPDLDQVVDHLVVVEAEAAMLVERLLRGRLVVCCNPTFDMGLQLPPMLARHGYAATWYYRPICATTYAAGRLGWPPGRWSNRAVGEALGVDRAGYGMVHSGLADAHYARALMEAAREWAP